MAATDALPIPRKGVAYRVTFDGRKSDGTLITSGTGMDSEISKDGGTFSDCTNEATEIATTSGIYYLDLTSTEMDADTVAIKVTWTNTNALPQVVALYPEETGDIRVAVTALSDGLLTAAKFAANALDAVWSTNTRTLTSFGTLVADTAAAVWDRLTSALTTSGSIGKWLLDTLGLVWGKVALLGTYNAVMPSPLNPTTGDIEVVRGDDYKAADGRALEWTNTAWAVLSLTTAKSITLKARTRYSDTVFTKAAMTPFTDTSARVELTSTETGSFAVGRDAYRFELEVVLANDDIITLALGKIHVVEDVR